jgi:CRP-like cAMP-binding protein
MQYFLDTGNATAYVDNEAVNQFGPGEFFGELAFITTAGSLMDAVKEESDSAGVAMHTRRSATVRAMENCRCLELGVRDFISVFEGDLVAMGNALRSVLPVLLTHSCSIQWWCLLYVSDGSHFVFDLAAS